MILFLDYDETLHPLWTFKEGSERVIAKPYPGPWLVEAPTLERILRPYLPRVEIVLSTMWAYTKGLDAARGMLPAALAERVTDSIWLPELDSDYRSARCTRYSCITAWLTRRRPNYSGPWLALDDDDNCWPEEERHRLVHSSGTLASPKVQQDLEEKLAKHAERGPVPR